MFVLIINTFIKIYFFILKYFINNSYLFLLLFKLIFYKLRSYHCDDTHYHYKFKINLKGLKCEKIILFL